MAKQSRPWVYVGGKAGNKPTGIENAAITQACERMIVTVLVPRLLPEVIPTDRRFPIRI